MGVLPLAGITSLVLVNLALAQTFTYWQSGTENWSTDTNWNNGEPGSGDYAYVNNGGTVQVDQIGEVCDHLTLGELVGEIGYSSMSAGDLTTDISLVGDNGTGSFFHTGGTNAVNEYISIGSNAGGDGTSGFCANANDKNIDDDPLFEDEENDDYTLTSSSPCIDEGDNSAVPTGIDTDLAGDDRITDGDSDTEETVDMGAYEYQP